MLLPNCNEPGPEPVTVVKRKIDIGTSSQWAQKVRLNSDALISTPAAFAKAQPFSILSNFCV